MVLPAQFDFVTVVVYHAEVHVGQAGGDDGRQGPRRDEDTGTVLPEDIAAEVEAVVEQVEVETDIALERGFPGNAQVAGGAELVTRHAVVPVHAEVVGTGFVPDTVHIHEADGIVEVVTHLAYGGAELEEVHPVDTLHEFLLGDDPSYRSRREQTVTGLARSEVLGAVVTGTHVQQVLVLVCIGDAADPAHISAGKPLVIHFAVVFLRIVITGLVVQQKAAHRMLVRELALVVDTGLEVPVLVVIRGFAVAHRRLASADDRQVGAVEGGVAHAETGVVRPGLVFYGLMISAGAGALLGDGHVGIVTSLHGGTQALGDEVQALGDRHIHVQRSLVLGAEAGPVVVLPSVPAGESLGDRLLGHRGDRHPVHDTRGTGRMGPEHRKHPDVAAVAVQRLAGVAYDTADIELHVRGLGEFEVQVGAVVITVVGIVVVVGHVRDLLQQTVLEHITHRNEVTHLVRTAADVDVVLGLQEGLAEHQLVPLGVREHDGVAAGTVSLDGLGRKVRIGSGDAIVPLEHVVIPGEVIAGALGDVGHGHLYASDGASGNLGLAHVAALGGDDDDTVRTAHTEHRGGSGVLQDGQALDFVRVHRVQRTLHAVHQDERRSVGV